MDIFYFSYMYSYTIDCSVFLGRTEYWKGVCGGDQTVTLDMHLCD